MACSDLHPVPAARRLLAALAATMVLVAAAVAPAAPVTYVIRPGEPNRVVFVSKAPLETFRGHTTAVAGTVQVDPGDLAAPLRVSVAVDLTTLTTDNRKRDEHMHQKHLETARFPRGTFRGDRLVDPPAGPIPTDRPLTVQLAGRLTLHGVTRERTVPVTLRRMRDGGLAVTAAFPVQLSEHSIKRPRFLVMKLSDTQQVHLDLRAVPLAGKETP